MNFIVIGLAIVGAVVIFSMVVIGAAVIFDTLSNN